MKEKEISRHLREQLIQQARRMRSEPTPAEALLWNRLSEKQLGGLKFRRQHIIHAYIVDFYCPAAKLVIEIDGSVHEGQEDYDKERTLDLSDRGYQVIRFKNKEIFAEIDKVLGIIYESCMRKINKL